MLESLFNKVVLIKLQPLFYQKVTPTQVLFCEICEIFKSTYFAEHMGTAASITSSTPVSRSSHGTSHVKKNVLKNFGIFTEKQLCWSLFLIRLQSFNSAALRLSHTAFNIPYLSKLSIFRKFLSKCGFSWK